MKPMKFQDYNLKQEIKQALDEMGIHTPTDIQEKAIPAIVEGEKSHILAQAIFRMRNNIVNIEEGYDGEYGQIKVFTSEELRKLTIQKQELFQISDKKTDDIRNKRKLLNFDLAEYKKIKSSRKNHNINENSQISANHLNQEQQKAAEHYTNPALIIAGPDEGLLNTLKVQVKDLKLYNNIFFKKLLNLFFVFNLVVQFYFNIFFHN